MKVLLLPFEVESFAIGTLFKKMNSEGHEVLIVNCDTWTYNDYHGRKNVLGWYNELNISNFVTMQSIHEKLLEEKNYDIDYEYLEEFEKKYCKSKNLIQLLLTDHIFGHGFRYPYYISFSNNQKLKWVELQLKWIENIINEFLPDMFFTMERNYFIKNVVWQIAKSRNIPMYTLVQGRVKSKFYISNNFGLGINQKLELILNEYSQKQLLSTLNYVNNYFQNNEFSIYNTSTTEKSLKENAYSLKKSIRELYWSIHFEIKHLIISRKRVKKLFRPTLGDYSEIKAILYHSRRFFNKIRYLSFNQRDFEQRLPKKPYIYFALHALPESSTLTLSTEYYEDDLIRFISKELPFGFSLVVKENPLMVGDRPYCFYKQLKKNVNIHLMDPLFPSKEIIKHTRGTVGISGTVLLETAMLNKPTLSFGEPDFKSILTFRDHSDIKAFIEACEQEKPKLDFSKTLRYLHYIIENGIALPWLDVLYKPRSKSFNHGVEMIYDLLKKTILHVNK